MQPYMNDIVKMKQLYGDKVLFSGGWDVYGPHNNEDATKEMVCAEVHRIVDTYCDDGRFIIYGGPLVSAEKGWDLFFKMNQWCNDEIKNYSREYLKKKFG